MSDNLPRKTWMPDDLAPSQAELVSVIGPKETVIEETESNPERQLA